MLTDLSQDCEVRHKLVVECADSHNHLKSRLQLRQPRQLTARPTDLYAYLLIAFTSVTGCLKNKRFIHECLIYTENNFSRTSNSLNCVNFTITLSVTFCIIYAD